MERRLILESIKTLILANILFAASMIYLAWTYAQQSHPDPGTSQAVVYIDGNSTQARPGYSDEYIEGKRLFKNNCAACHNKNMEDDMVGPALRGVEERWGNYPKEDLYRWIRNSGELIAAKHPRAVQLIGEWITVMNPFPKLSDAEIEAILTYIETDALPIPGS